VPVSPRGNERRRLLAPAAIVHSEPKSVQVTDVSYAGTADMGALRWTIHPPQTAKKQHSDRRSFAYTAAALVRGTIAPANIRASVVQ
jgi:hypothetical protein